MFLGNVPVLSRRRRIRISHRRYPVLTVERRRLSMAVQPQHVQIRLLAGCDQSANQECPIIAFRRDGLPLGGAEPRDELIPGSFAKLFHAIFGKRAALVLTRLMPSHSPGNRKFVISSLRFSKFE
jgi:hypothetical protein